MTFLLVIALVIPSLTDKVDANGTTEWFVAYYRITSTEQFLAIQEYGTTTINVTTYRNLKTNQFRYVARVNFTPKSQYRGYTMRMHSVIDVNQVMIVPYVSLYNAQGSYISNFGTAYAVRAYHTERINLPDGTTPFRVQSVLGIEG